MGLDTRSPESVYATRNNIVIPITYHRSNADVDLVAAQHEELDTTDLPKTHTRSGSVITGTYTDAVGVRNREEV